MTRLTTLDLPSIHRHFVGFDSMFDEMDRMFENSAKVKGIPHTTLYRSTKMSI